MFRCDNTLKSRITCRLPSRHQPDHIVWMFVLCLCPIKNTACHKNGSFQWYFSGGHWRLAYPGFLAPLIGGWIGQIWCTNGNDARPDNRAAGITLLPAVNALWWVWLCMVPIGLGFAMSSYETAFSAAVQIDEVRSRKYISFITFYGGVASSVIWLSIAPLLTWFGLEATCVACGISLVLMGVRSHHLDKKTSAILSKDARQMRPFHWALMTQNERRAMIALASASALEYLTFASTTLLWITWFTTQFNDVGLAVMLAALYGPFQTVGRILRCMATI